MTDIELTEGAIGDVGVVAVTGSADIYGALALRESLERLDERGHSRILLDLTACDFLDSYGLAAINLARKRAADKGGELAVAGAPEPILKIFRITGLVRLLPMYETRDQAVAAMSEGDEDDE